MVESFRLPETAPGSGRIGRDPVTQSTCVSTQLSADAETSPADVTLVSLTTDTPLCETGVAEGTQAEEVGIPV